MRLRGGDERPAPAAAVAGVWALGRPTFSSPTDKTFQTDHASIFFLGAHTARTPGPLPLHTAPTSPFYLPLHTGTQGHGQRRGRRTQGRRQWGENVRLRKLHIHHHHASIPSHFPIPPLPPTPQRRPVPFCVSSGCPISPCPPDASRPVAGPARGGHPGDERGPAPRLRGLPAAPPQPPPPPPPPPGDREEKGSVLCVASPPSFV